MVVTPTSAAYGRDNPRVLGRCPENLSGLRIWTETPMPPVLGKERSTENAHIFGAARSHHWIGRFCFISQVRPWSGEPHPTSTTNHDPSRQIRPPDYRPAHLHHGPLQLSLCLLPLRRPGKLSRPRGNPLLARA